MAFTTLIDTPRLARHLDAPDWVIVDCRFALDDPGWGEREYAVGRIPNAQYAHVDRDLSGQRTGTNGRHPLPDPEDLSRTLGRWGISSGVQVVAYDQDTGAYASRLWWLLRWLGHDDAAVLDGGFAKWTREGRQIESARPSPPPGRVFSPTVHANMVVPVKEMVQLVGDPSVRLVDARAPERYSGEVEPIDKVAGHIPGAVNHPFQRNVRQDGTFRPIAELVDNWTQTTGGVRPENLVCYCGSGVTACQNVLALEHAGIKGARLYGGSWSEWSSDPSRPIARGMREEP